MMMMLMLGMKEIRPRVDEVSESTTPSVCCDGASSGPQGRLPLRWHTTDPHILHSISD